MNINLNNASSQLENKIAIILNNIETEKENTLKNKLKEFLLQETKNILKSKKQSIIFFTAYR